MISLYLTRSNSSEKVYLLLPATPGEIGEAWGALDQISDDVSSTCIADIDCNVWGVDQYLKNADINNQEQFEKMNQIAGLTEILNDDECRKFEGTLKIEEVNNLDDIINIGETLDQYILIPGCFTAYTLGVFLVESGIKRFDEDVIPYLNYFRIGTEFDSNYGGTYTQNDYVVRRDCLAQTVIDAIEIYEQKSYEMQMG